MLRNINLQVKINTNLLRLGYTTKRTSKRLNMIVPVFNLQFLYIYDIFYHWLLSVAQTLSCMYSYLIFNNGRLMV